MAGFNVGVDWGRIGQIESGKKKERARRAGKWESATDRATDRTTDRT